MLSLDFLKQFLYNRNSPVNMFSTYILLSFGDDYIDELPELREETSTYTRIAVPKLAFFKDGKTVQYIAPIMEELIIGKDENGEEDANNTTTTQYILLTKEEQMLFEKRKDYEKRKEPIPKELLNVRTEYDLDVSPFYSSILENYLVEGSQFTQLRSFMDYLVPCIEREQVSLVKLNVIRYISKNKDWLEHLKPNEVFVDTPAEDTAPTQVANDIRYAINRYLTTVSDVFAILSAHKRGSDVATSTLLKSCPEYISDRETLLDNSEKAEDLMLSPLFRRLPLFTDEFMKQFLLGHIPIFVRYTEAMTDSDLELDIFKDFKVNLARNITSMLKRCEASKFDVKKNLEMEEEGYIDIPMRRMYASGLKSTSGGYALKTLFDSKYKCLMVNYLLYVEVLRHYKKLKLKDMRMRDFIEVVSPIQL